MLVNPFLPPQNTWKNNFILAHGFRGSWPRWASSCALNSKHHGGEHMWWRRPLTHSAKKQKETQGGRGWRPDAAFKGMPPEHTSSHRAPPSSVHEWMNLWGLNDEALVIWSLPKTPLEYSGGVLYTNYYTGVGKGRSWQSWREQGSSHLLSAKRGAAEQTMHTNPMPATKH